MQQQELTLMNYSGFKFKNTRKGQEGWENDTVNWPRAFSFNLGTSTELKKGGN